MSNSLVRKSLELLGYEKDTKHEKRKKKRINPGSKLELIKAKHRIISQETKTDLVTALGRSGKVSVYEARKRKATRRDPTDENVQKLLLLSTKRVDSETAEQLLERGVKKKCIPKKEKPKEQESTVFTEEDFKKFEEEYMNE